MKWESHCVIYYMPPMPYLGGREIHKYVMISTLSTVNMNYFDEEEETLKNTCKYNSFSYFTPSEKFFTLLN